MFSNLDHFLCLSGMSHYLSFAGKNHGLGSPLLFFSLLPLPVLCRKREEINRREGAAHILDVAKENDS